MSGNWSGSIRRVAVVSVAALAFITGTPAMAAFSEKGEVTRIFPNAKGDKVNFRLRLDPQKWPWAASDCVDGRGDLYYQIDTTNANADRWMMLLTTAMVSGLPVLVQGADSECHTGSHVGVWYVILEEN